MRLPLVKPSQVLECFAVRGMELETSSTFSRTGEPMDYGKYEPKHVRRRVTSAKTSGYLRIGTQAVREYRGPSLTSTSPRLSRRPRPTRPDSGGHFAITTSTLEAGGLLLEIFHFPFEA